MGFTQVNSSRFSIAVGQLLDQYSEDARLACRIATEETTDEMVKELKAVKSGHTGKPWKKFPRAWTKEIKQLSWGAVRGTVHLKKPMYRIGHLLEFDHAARNGGRVAGDNFIAPIAERYEAKYVEKMKDMLGKVV